MASLEPDLLLVTSLFEGFNENAIGTIGSLGVAVPTAVILYDLIPYRYPELYTGNGPVADWYLEKTQNFKRADLWLAISGHARREGIELLGLPDTDVVNIAAAADSRFRPVGITPEHAGRLRQSLGVTRPFILTTGGAEARKNQERLIQAFSRLPNRLQESHQLVVYGCSEPDKSVIASWRSKYGLRADQVILTEHVPDDELVALYNLCELFAFPSWHEGFGLPALEAMQCGAPTIGADATSLPEVIGRDDALFNPCSVEDITAKITEVLTDESFRNALAEHGVAHANTFSWDRTARTAIGAMEDAARQPEVRARFSHQENYRALVEKIGRIPRDSAAPTEGDLTACAAAIADNQEQAARLRRPLHLPERLTWRIEGPFDSSYSLALLNRETARALDMLGHRVALHSTEGPGDFPPRDAFLQANEDLARLHAECRKVSQEGSDVVSRNLYPPRVSDMKGRLNLLHHYAWEESGFPLEWADDFSVYLDGVTCLSDHVQKVLIDHGVTSRLSVSGCGVDHWERIAPDHNFTVEGKSFRFLHVSSCFPRKGADLLLQAYGRSFSAKDDVTLIIKTHPNPHNEIRKWLADAKADRQDFPDVLIIEDDLADSQLKALYHQCHVLVAPSKAEGFGLPIAEAMLSGLPVITTAWGGQLDFCDDNSAWLIDYDFEAAQSHFGVFDSAWARPRVEDLAERMRELYEMSPGERQQRAAVGRTRLMENFRWCDVAERLVLAARQCAETPSVSSPRIGWVTTWNTRCGIAGYSEHLVRNMSSEVTILAPRNQARTATDEENVLRCWSIGDDDDLSGLQSVIDDRNFDTVVIQFNYGFFSFDHLNGLLAKLLDDGRTVVVVLHSTTDPTGHANKRLEMLRETLSRCARILVHALPDLNRLKLLGLVRNVTLFPHGVLDHRATVSQPTQNRNFVVASYGFFLPNKGLLELIEAISLLNSQGISATLAMINAEYPDGVSGKLIREARDIVSERRLQSKIEIETSFLSDEECLTRLSGADLIVFPYQKTGESSSAAVRHGLAVGKPVAVTPLPIFDDVSPAVFRLPGCTPQDIAEGIDRIRLEILENSETYKQVMHDAERWRASHRHSQLGRRLDGMLTALARQNRGSVKERAETTSDGQVLSYEAFGQHP